MSNQANGTATRKKARTNNGATNIETVVSKEKPKTSKPVQEPTPEQIAKERLERLVSLQALQADIEQLENAARDFNSIRNYSEVEVTITCNGHTAFRTGRTDTVEAATSAIEQSITDKRLKAYAELAAFEF